MTFRRFRDQDGNECMAVGSMVFSNDAQRGEEAASKLRGHDALSVHVQQQGSFVRNGVEFYSNASGGVAMRTAGRSFASILCSEANAKPDDSN